MSKKFSAIIISIFFISTGLWAGGWNNTLMGCRAIALGGAFVGIADDPSAIFYNPAGLAFQRENMAFAINGFHISPTHEYTMVLGSKIQSKDNSTLPQIFLSYRLNEKITIGFGAYAPYATGGVDWKEGQFAFPLKTYLGVLSLTPTLAYKISDKFSIGFKLNIYKSVLELDTEMAPYGPIHDEENGSAISGGIGMFYKASEKASFGLSIRGPSKMKLSGKTTVTTIVPGIGTMELKLKSETQFSLPWDFEVGFSYRVTPNFLISTSAQYTMWSTLDEVKKTIGDLETNERFDFNDILILRIGAEYVLSSGIVLRGGIGVDKAASPTETLSINNIDVDKFTLLGGIGYRVGKMQIDFAYVHAQGKERERTVPPLLGKYNLNASIIGLGVTFTF